jgi:hypothetical protein
MAVVVVVEKENENCNNCIKALFPIFMQTAWRWLTMGRNKSLDGENEFFSNKSS